MPRPAAAIALFAKNQVLLIRRSKPPSAGGWHLPGGAQEWGETIAACAARELAEETGLAAPKLRFTDIVDVIDRDSSGAIAFHYTIAIFAGILPVHEKHQANAASDAADLAWVALHRLDEFGVTAQVRRIIAGAADLLGVPATEK
jgi:ADP-ribose pyrophosphatase YjhB (NUDIX family)